MDLICQEDFDNFCAKKSGGGHLRRAPYIYFFSRLPVYFLPTIIADSPSIIMPALRFEPKIASAVST